MKQDTESLQITDRYTLDRFLERRSREDVEAIAIRAALRFLPLLSKNVWSRNASDSSRSIVEVFRAASASWLAAHGGVYGSGEIRAAAAAADPPGAAFGATADVVAGSGFNTNTAVVAIAAASEYFLSNHGNLHSLSMWKIVEADVDLLRKVEREYGGGAAYLLIDRPLWPESEPLQDLREAWHDIRLVLLAEKDAHWWVWTEWYEARLRGDPPDLPLERERVLIPNEDWEKGPAHVNAIIARLIERHRHPTPEDLPAERPSPLHFDYRDGAIRLTPPPSPSIEAERRAGVDSAHDALSELIANFLEGGGGGQNRRVAKTLDRCLNALGGSIANLDPVKLGIHASALQAFAERADEVMLAEDAAELVTINAQLALFVGQFPEWADYQRGVADAFAAAETEQEAVRLASEARARMAEVEPDLVAPEAEDEILSLEGYAIPEPSPEDEASVAPPLARRAYLRAIRSFLRANAKQALADLEAGRSTGMQKFAECTTVSAFTAAGSTILALAAGLPSEFGWMAGIITFLTRMRGSSPGSGRTGKDDDTLDT